jgi:ABC-type amino acid transport system permease subunit
MTSLNEFFNSVQVIYALMIIALAVYFGLVERKAHKK